MRFLDLFAGIGGFRMGFDQSGHECVGWVECDPHCSRCKQITPQTPSEKHNHTICDICGKEKRQHARFSYEAIHNTEGEWTAYDITKVTDEEWRKFNGTVDIITGGFPCQAFSIAGKRQGFDDTRGTMFFEIARAVKQIQPRFLVLENVKGLLSHDKGKTFAVILSTLDELGYDAEWQVLNTKDFSTKDRPTPQNRERVFIIGHLRGHSRREIFPIGGNASEVSIEIVGSTKGEHCTRRGDSDVVYNPDGLSGALLATDYKQPKQIIVKGDLDIKQSESNRRVYDSEGISPSLRTMQGGGQIPIVVQDRHGVMIKEATKKGYAEADIGDSINFSIPNSKTRRGRVGKGVAQTLDTQCDQATLTPDYRIRKLTPKECWRLQGFSDWAFEKAEAVNSNSQLYKQAGNSVSVPVVYEIAKRLEEAPE